jgi:ABC-2 type transport system permease protein
MKKILTVAWREYKATVLTKAFLIGVLLAPVIMIVSIVAITLLQNFKPPAVKGTIAIMDQTSKAAGSGDKPLVFDAVVGKLSVEAMRKEAEERGKKLAEVAKSVAGDTQIPGAAGAIAAASSAEKLPEFTIKAISEGAELEAFRKGLVDSNVFEGGNLALVTIPPGAVVKSTNGGFESFQMAFNAKLDTRARSPIEDAVERSIVDARMKLAGLDPAQVRAITATPSSKSVELTAKGEKSSSAIAQFLLPVAFMMLLWISVFSGGQSLLTNTIEEKSNRVMEVLLSAVSPFQLMVGKIVGQMGAGLTLLCLYSGAGIISLVLMARNDLVQPWQVVCLLGFFLIAYCIIASLFAAVGSAVSDLQEANTLLGPVMIIVMMPMLLMFPIMQSPSGTLAKVLSFTPPVSPFVMVLRVSSTEPPPAWEVIVSAVVGVITAFGMMWMASKIFRVGVLMYGKPPSFGTLLKWIRMA